MPTSSQSLILQTTNGHLPPFFGRRVWRAEPPPGPEWTSTEYPMSTVQIRQNFVGLDNKQYKTGKKSQSLKRAGSAPELICKVDFSSLPNLLKIRGLHGTVKYDSEDKYLSWKINSIGPFYNRLNLRGRYPVAGKSSTGTLKYFHADRANDSIYNRDEMSFVENMNRLEARRQVHFDEHETNFETEPNYNKRLIMTDNVFMSVVESDGKLRMVKTNIENADYFKLVQIKEPPSNQNYSNDVPIFRLESCQSTEVGCFRLAPTGPRDVGDFKLVPSQGYLADDFRLVPSPEVKGAFIILQSDTGNPGQYRPVLRNKDTHGEFRFVQAKIQQGPSSDVFIPHEAWGTDTDYSEGMDKHGHHTLTNLRDKIVHAGSSDHAYNYFNEITDRYRPSENNNLPDISLYEPTRNSVMHPQPTSSKIYNDNSTFEKDLRTFNQHLDEFNQRYQESMQRVSSQDVKRPTVSFQNKPYNGKEDRKSTIVDSGLNSKDLSIEWKTHNFDQWSRTTKKSQQEPLDYLDDGVTRTVQKVPSIRKDKKEISEAHDSQMDEAQFKAHYKQWKKKKVATVRMRKVLPPSDPFAVCIRFEGNDISHNKLKSMIERDTCQTVVGLQFDPVSVHSVDPEAMSRWIVRFSDTSVCDEFSKYGITVNGVKLRVRKFDDVMKEEHEAYKLYKLVKEFTAKKQQKPSVRKDVKMPKVLKTIQTQTKQT